MKQLFQLCFYNRRSEQKKSQKPKPGRSGKKKSSGKIGKKPSSGKGVRKGKGSIGRKRR